MWLEDQREQLKKTYNKCKSEEQEPVLEAFSVYLLRILNGLSQMESSKLYGYEAQLLGEAMRLFCEHYMLQVGRALDHDISSEKKKEIIRDIEDAISKISNVYKNVIDSTANSDRQMFTSQAVETNIYDISPKLFATYSVILETLVRLFDKQGVYAFLLHPSLKSNIETTSLFDLREKEGKVVLIYIPENEIEKIRQIPTYLLHEAFHVLTKEERNRKDRARCMETHVLNAVSQRIFKNVDFGFVSSNTAEGIKNNLMKRWSALDLRLQELGKMDKGDRSLYSRNIIKQICENWRNWLSDIFTKIGEDLCQVMGGVTYKDGEEPYAHIVGMEWEIQRNLVEILARNLVEKYADMYMTVYREAYADIACILTTGISPGEYEQAFRDSAVISDVSDRDTLRMLRIYLVSKAIADCDGVSHAGEWKEYSIKNDFRKQKGNQTETVDGKKARYDEIRILEQDLASFEEILMNCSQKLWGILGQGDDKFEKFREIISGMDLVDILNGGVNEKLRKL